MFWLLLMIAALPTAAAASQLARWSVQCTEALMMHFAIFLLLFTRILESSDSFFLFVLQTISFSICSFQFLVRISILTLPFFYYRKVASFIETTRGFAALLYCMFLENHFFCPLWIGKFILKFIRHTLVRVVCVWHDDSAAPETFFLFFSFSMGFNCRQLKRQRRCWTSVSELGKREKKEIYYYFLFQFVDAEKEKRYSFWIKFQRARETEFLLLNRSASLAFSE